MKKWLIPRRTFLRGAGGGLLLPMLDSMFINDAQALAVTARFAAFFMPLGIYGLGYDPSKSGAQRYFPTSPTGPDGMGAWLPRSVGPLAAPLPPILEPLESFKKKLAIVSNVGTMPGDDIDNGRNHSTATTAWLTSAWSSAEEAKQINIMDQNSGAKKPGNNTPPDSIDQYIANSLGIPAGTSLVLNPDDGDYSENETGGHGGYISYNSKLSDSGSTIVKKTTDPMKAFNVLFGNCGNKLSDSVKTDNKSVLDFVKSDIENVQKKAGTADKARLAAYFQNIRDLEVKLDAAQKQCPAPPAQDPSFPGGELDWVTTINLMVDVVALALTSGIMPVATLMTRNEGGNETYGKAVDLHSNFLGVDGKKVKFHTPTLGIHFDITHVDSDNAVAAAEHIAYSQVMTWFVSRLLTKMDSMPAEPNGLTPLDNSIILVGACHSHSGYHNTHNLPTLLAGGKGFGMAQGEHIQMPKNTDIGDLFYTMAKAMGVAGTSFNGRKKILPRIF